MAVLPEELDARDDELVVVFGAERPEVLRTPSAARIGVPEVGRCEVHRSDGVAVNDLVVELAESAELLAAVAARARAVALVELLVGPDVHRDPAEPLREVELQPGVVLRVGRVGEDAVVGDVCGIEVHL